MVTEEPKQCDYGISKIYQFYGSEKGFNSKDVHYCLVHNNEKLKTTRGTDNITQSLKMKKYLLLLETDTLDIMSNKKPKFKLAHT